MSKFHILARYPTFCNLAGVADCHDFIVRPDVNHTLDIDGVDQWPRLTGASTAIGHEYLPTTEAGIIWEERYKLIVSAPSTFWYDKNDTHFPDSVNRSSWPCRNGERGSESGLLSEQLSVGGCAMCTSKEPCLFDLRAGAIPR